MTRQAPVCPECKLNCPATVQCPVPKAGVVTCPSCPSCPAAAAEAEVVASARAKMLSRPLKNIIECSADAKDTSCRLGKKRFEALGQKGATLWMTGLSGAGKTTICKALEKELLFTNGKNVYNIDGATLRHTPCARTHTPHRPGVASTYHGYTYHGYTYSGYTYHGYTYYRYTYSGYTYSGYAYSGYAYAGDNLRTGLTRDLGFSAEDRGESVRRASEVAALFNEAGIITVVTLISPYRKDRDAARARHARSGLPFLEALLTLTRTRTPTSTEPWPQP